MIRKILKILLFAVGGIVLLLLVLVGILWIKSPGEAQPITDASGKVVEGGISTIEKITLGGKQQYVIIRGHSTDKPVMLFLHGGPGSPELPFMKHFNTDIERDFIMVYWEQLGAGKSYSKDIPPESMTLPQFISDTREISAYLAKRFNQKKIFLMGHSWGSLLGILTAYEYPDLFHAYFGVGQVAQQLRGEKISFEWVKQRAIDEDDKGAIKELSAMEFPDSTASDSEWLNFLLNERKYVFQYGGAIRGITNMWPVIKLVLGAKEYTLKEKINYMEGSTFSLHHLFPEVLRADLSSRIDSMQIPVYIFQGVHDYQTPYTVAKDFYDRLKAPEKELFTFAESAHSPLMEEVDKFNSLVREKAKHFPVSKP